MDKLDVTASSTPECPGTQGNDMHTTTDALFREFGEPNRWQEIHRKLQQLTFSA